MAQTKHQIQAALSELGTHPRHRFGQNFMIDQNLVRIVAQAGEITAADCVIEVGPGTGTLTEELLTAAGRVCAVEIDRDLASLLRGRFASNAGLQLIEGDALAGKHALNSQVLAEIASQAEQDRTVKLVANLPYNIASPLIIEMLIAGVQTLAFTVQKEVGARLKAGAGNDDYGPLSVMAQMLSRVELLRTLPPQAFWPAPKIESALIRMRREDRVGMAARPFGAFVHALFSFRRKTLRKALAEAGNDARAVLEITGLDGARRPEEFAPEDFWAMYRAATAPLPLTIRRETDLPHFPSYPRGSEERKPQ
jgi:16S rRNA (adenine1518-N6/adenine1519-N6)-dimethyltransferase